MSDEDRSSPYSVATPNFPISDSGRDALPDAAEVVTVGELLELLEQAALYWEMGPHCFVPGEPSLPRMPGDPVLPPGMVMAPDITHGLQFGAWIERFRGIVDIDRVRTHIHVHCDGRPLSESTARWFRRLLICKCGLTETKASALSLGEAMDRLEGAFHPDLSELTFEQWLAYIRSFDHKSAVKASLPPLFARPRGEQIQVWRSWIEYEKGRIAFAARVAKQTDERRTIDQRFKSQPGYAELLADPRHVALEERRLAVQAEFDRFADERGWGVLSRHDLTPDEQTLLDQRTEERKEAFDSIKRDERALESEYGIEYFRPQLPAGWKGYHPHFDVESLPALVKYLEGQIQYALGFHVGVVGVHGPSANKGRDIELLNDAVHNAYCLLRPLGIPSTPAMPQPFTNFGEAEASLTNLLQWLGDRLQSEESQHATMNARMDHRLSPGKNSEAPTPAAKIGQNHRARGFMSIADLVAELGVHQSQIAAFEKALRRKRLEAPLGARWWKPVEKAGPNEPKYLFLADSPEVIQIAEGYRQPKRK